MDRRGHYPRLLPKKRITEDCLQFRISDLRKAGLLGPGGTGSGTLAWRTPDGTETGSVQVDVQAGQDGRLELQLTYGSQEGQPVVERIALTETGQHFGGRRHWFICPLVVGGQLCGAHVDALFLPSDETFFGCRKCHDLSYRSAQVGRNQRNENRQRV